MRYALPANCIRPNELADSVPVIMAGILAVYGLVVSITIANTLRPETHLFTAFVHLGAGIAVGLASLGAGFAIGITGDAGVRGSSQQPKLYVGMMLIQIFSEVLGESSGSVHSPSDMDLDEEYNGTCHNESSSLMNSGKGLYGMIVALIMLSSTTSITCG
jgi:V-type H+-transporting ATPase proteolipid subunit